MNLTVQVSEYRRAAKVWSGALKYTLQWCIFCSDSYSLYSLPNNGTRTNKHDESMWLYVKCTSKVKAEVSKLTLSPQPSRFTTGVWQQWPNPPQTGLTERRRFQSRMDLIYKTLFLVNCQRKANGQSTEATWREGRERGKINYSCGLQRVQTMSYKVFIYYDNFLSITTLCTTLSGTV